MKIKIKLSKNEYVAVFMAMKLISINMFSSGIEVKATQELMQKVYMRMAQKMFDLKKENTLSLSYAEAWAFYKTMPNLMAQLGNYEQLAIQTVINIIHQKTV